MNRDLLDTVNPPRRNGELVFDAPWEGRSFGLVLALHERGLFQWEEFRQQLKSSIAENPEGDYYERWLVALERLLLQKSLVTRLQIADRVDQFASGAREVVY